jgi:hypothetical protein
LRAIWNRKTLTPGKVRGGADDRTACAEHHVSLKIARALLRNIRCRQPLAPHDASQHPAVRVISRRDRRNTGHASAESKAGRWLRILIEWRNKMTRLKLLGAAALVLSTALAAPAMAQQAISHPANCEARYPNANCSNLGPGNPYTGSYQRHAAYRNGNGNNGWQQDSWNDNRRDSGFWPGDVAAGVVDGAVTTAGAAVGTAGAIAAAPFAGDSYAYDNGGGYNNGWNNSGWNNQSYAQRNGFVCTPGTFFRGEDGRRHLCQ